MRAGRPYAFVVHGLWPQFERGYPEDCPTDEPDVSNETLRTLYDLMPSAGLIRHRMAQARHLLGAVARRDYFDGAARGARDGQRFPQQFRRLDSYKTLDPDDAEAAFLEGQSGRCRRTASRSPATSAICARCASA